MGKKNERENEKERTEETGGVLDRISLALTLVAVSVFAIFTGYLVGQYAIRWVASPLGEIPVVTEDPGVLAPSDSAGARPAPAESASSAPASSPSAQAPATSAPAPSSRAPAASGSASPGTGQPATASGGSAAAATAAGQARSSVVRVHVGHFQSREAAQEVAEALKTGSPAIPDAWVLYDEAAREYRVQAGAFTNEARANELIAALRARRYEAFIAP